MEENILKYRERAKRIVENSYDSCGMGAAFPGVAFLVADNDLIRLLNLGKKINIDSVIANVDDGLYDEKLDVFFNPNKKQPDNIIAIEKKFENQDLQKRYEELIKAINNDMPLSFFWLAGSIIECLLREYCKKNNIKSSNNCIDGYITAIEKDEKHKKNIPGRIKKTIPIYQDYRNTIHPDNQNNDFINGKNLQIYKEELDNVIKYFTNDEALEALKQKNDNNKKQENTKSQRRS